MENMHKYTDMCVYKINYTDWANLIWSGVPPEMALHTAHTASFLILYSAVFMISNIVGITALSNNVWMNMFV